MALSPDQPTNIVYENSIIIGGLFHYISFIQPNATDKTGTGEEHDLFTNELLVKEIRQEFETKRGNYQYKAILPEGPPPIPVTRNKF